MTFAWLAWKPRGNWCNRDLIQLRLWTRIFGRRRQGNRDFRISAKKFHRHVDITHAMFVGEINRSLGVEKIVGVGGVPGPGVHGAQVMEGLPVLKQYLHIFGSDIEPAIWLS